jgi:hypothetical protein
MRPIENVAALASILALSAGCAASPSTPSARAVADEAARAVNESLDDWHDAAAHADEGRYFGHFAPDGVFLGTDATERWDIAAFRAYAHPRFAKGKAWSFRAMDRHVTFDEGGKLAWFDEALTTEGLGPARGSGVVRKDAGGHWEIVQYNLAITVPNERFAEVKRLLEASSAADAGAK